MRHTEIELTVRGLANKPQVFYVPGKYRQEVKELLRQLQHGDEDFIPAEEIFPDVFDSVKGPAVALRGARHREEMTQVELAKTLGIRQHHLSEMEHGKRPIGKAMAKKLGKKLRCDYRLFL